MLTRIKRRLDADDGISLIEVLVAFTLLAVVLSASANSMISSFAAINGAESRTRATALANELLENMRSVPWEEVGFFADESPPSGAVLVDIDGVSTRPSSCTATPIPAGCRVLRVQETRDGYTVSRFVEWQDNALTEGAEDYKRLVVTLEWVDRGTIPRTISAETVRSPEPDEQAASPFVLSLFDAAPSVVHLDQDSASGSFSLQETVQLTARTSSPAEFLKAEYIDRAGTLQSVSLTSPSGNKVDWTGSLTDGNLPNGDLILTFSATRYSPAKLYVLGSRTLRVAQPLVFAAVDATPSAVCLGPTGISPPIEVRADVEGLVPTDEVVVAWGSAESQRVTADIHRVDADDDGLLRDDGGAVSGARFIAVVPEGMLPEGIHSLAVTATRFTSETLSTTTQVTVQRRETEEGSCS